MYTILIVEDMQVDLALLSHLLAADYRVLTADSGQRALEMAASEPRPDLILLDIMMPKMDGYQVIRRLRADPATASIPVIFVTALNNDTQQELGLSLGAVEYITKPISPDVVLEQVKKAIQAGTGN